MNRRLLGAATLGFLLGTSLGCEDLNVGAKKGAPTTAAQIVTNERRYELHEIRNGNYYGSALLDTKTGRIWTLGTESKGGTVQSSSFGEVLVFPKPETASDDPLGLFTKTDDKTVVK